MKKELMQYVLSIVIGTCIGGFLFKYLHWPVLIGAFTGGVFAYITCGCKDFILGVKNAYKKVALIKSSKIILGPQIIVRIKYALLYIFMYIGAFVSLKNIFSLYSTVNYVTTLVFPLAVLACIASALIGLLGFIAMFSEEKEESMFPDYIRTWYKKSFLTGPAFFNPLTIVPMFITFGVIFIYHLVINYKQEIFLFFKILFMEIHNRLRFAAGIWTIIGTTGGYMYGGESQILIGMLIGISLGLIDYLVVSICILKLKPAL